MGSSFKCMDEFRDFQKESIQEAFDMGDLTTGRGLNQELDLSRACDTLWGSHLKSFNNIILMFGSILDVLESLVLDAHSTNERAKAMEYFRACQTFELASYIIDVHDDDERFSDRHVLCDLSKRLVQTKKHSNYPHVFRLVKLALLLPVATASVE
ncbi:PREDICTED: uncharacterized protein LOC109220134 [Nicotiana attenuata]|uniref:uncharacterized protein LOC109220134 n=1 Tax=Nicotiana attenuata TaxID=49451 RepID=UPI00090478E3|nr:PREDICTED: uncharacterized protein LOC109220134 [Nicotiana attenuata]